MVLLRATIIAIPFNYCKLILMAEDDSGILFMLSFKLNHLTSIKKFRIFAAISL